jgi:thiopeptide-type bacteriocin biosynthesis protein
MSARENKPLFRPLDWFMVRTPLLPVEDYLALAERPMPDTLLPEDPRVRRALAVGGGDLARALGRPVRDDRARRKLSGKLLRYLIRMSTRPTPYGLYAGVALAQWGERTDLAVAPAEPHIRTRPDMGWLMSLVTTLEQRPEVRAGSRWFANPTALVHAGRVHLTDRAPVTGSPGQPVSLRTTAPVRHALKIARDPVPYHRLLDELMILTGAGRPKVERLLEQLWEQTVLLTDLRPPLTTTDPAQHVLRCLARIPEARAEAEALAELVAAMREWDRLGAERGAADYPTLLTQANAVHPVKSTDGPAQTDMAVPLAGRLVNAVVGAEAAKAGELLLRLSPAPRGPSSLDEYRHDFESRYGPDAEVPILELLHPETGLGVPAHVHGAGPSGNRQRILRELALDAIRERRLVLDLDEQTLGELETWRPAVANAPTSLDVSVFVVAASPAAVDKGEFQVVTGPNLGAAAAGRNLGRFADLLGHDAESALAAAAEAEAAARPGRRWAEVVYQPRRARSANVTIRPLVRDGEVVLDTVPGGLAEGTIPVSELVVGVRDGRLVVRWPTRDVEVVPCAGHMLNNWGAPAVVRFLDEVGRDGRPELSSFDWGPAMDFPFLPRVQVGRVVLALATWRLTPSALRDSLDSWREHWQVPRYVYLTEGDNRLLLDLDNPCQADQLRAELRRLPEDRSLTLSEALPAPADAWLPGAPGRYVSEFVVPVVLAERDLPRTSARRPRCGHHQPSARPPGSEWLFAKLYCPPPGAAELIAGPIRTFCEQARSSGLAQDWFFIRYADPEPHLRVRLRGEPERLSAELAPQLLRWASALVENGSCRRLCIDTYDQEVARYGGSDGLAVAEALFAADSRAVADLLDLTQREPDFDCPRIAPLSVDTLLSGLGLDEAQRVDWYRAAVPDRRATAKEYRNRQAELRSLLGDQDGLRTRPGGAEAIRILDTLRADLAPLTARLDELAARDTLWHPKVTLARSFVHMHCNRLFGGGEREQRLYGLLVRARESLSHIK